MASYLAPIFFEVLTAPSFTDAAMAILKKKKNLRVLETGKLPLQTNHIVGRFIGNDLLLQEKDYAPISASDLKVVTDRAPSKKEVENMLFAWKVVKHVKSNAIVTAADMTTCGIGGGQVSRVDATKIAIMKSDTTKPMVLASDAFFPFRDNIDALESSGVTAIIQPGGSIRDQEVIAACNELNIAMVFTGTRSFLHG
jgi:phosphoribosylaminoimidazolecarboxamide formyltransferase/IMP cyclohydrolase